MVDISALMRALPVSSLEPDTVAILGGFIDRPKDEHWKDSICLLEPPAGRRVPYIEPVRALETLLRRQGVALDEAQVQARAALARMKADIEAEHWINYLDALKPASPDCFPVPDFVAWLRGEHQRIDRSTDSLTPDAQGFSKPASDALLVPSDILDFFEQAAVVTARTPMFRGPDNWDEPWSLQDLPATPPPKAMIEFFPGPPWGDIDAWDDWRVTDNPFMRWRETIRPIAFELERALGEPVYDFADLTSDIDDDYAHRFLVLHWCCTYQPESTFVRYLLKVSGAEDVEELKAALIDPANYRQPFEMYCASSGLDAVACRIDYLPPGVRKTFVVVFSTLAARNTAQALLAHAIGAHAFIIAPEELATDAWVAEATRYCRDWIVRYLRDETLDEPLDILALADELCVIANETRPGPGFDLKLSDSAEELLWLAIELGVEARYCYLDRTQLWKPELGLKDCGVAERVAARKAQCAAFTRQLKEIRLDNEFGSSGLWDEDGRMLGYDQLDLPFPLVRRIAAWQRDFDDTVTPPDEGSDEWWDRHEEEQIEIAKALQVALGPEVAVKLYRREGWLTIDQIARAAGGEA